MSKRAFDASTVPRACLIGGGRVRHCSSPVDCATVPSAVFAYSRTWLLNLLCTYWFMSDVFPTLNKESQRREEGHERTARAAVDTQRRSHSEGRTGKRASEGRDREVLRRHLVARLHPTTTISMHHSSSLCGSLSSSSALVLRFASAERCSVCVVVWSPRLRGPVLTLSHPG